MTKAASGKKALKKGTCPNCGGEGTEECSTCGGDGSCPTCQSEDNCPECDKGRIDCGYCMGTGEVDE